MFDAKKETEKIIDFIRDYYSKNNIKGVVIGISGGKDSAVVAALFSKAIGSENVLGVTMPCNSKDEDRLDAKLISDFYGFELINVDLSNMFKSFKEEINLDEKYLLDSDINIKPRIRMSTLYYLAAAYSKIKNGTYIVAGTSNKLELYVGYFTKGGDSVSDIRVISDLTVSEVIKIGEYLKVPEKVLYKTPSDGLSNKTDEEKLEVKYSDIEKYLNNEEIDEKIKERIEYLHKINQHKFNIPEYKK